MFAGCRSLKSIIVSHFNTSSVTTLESIFNSCYSLKTLDVENWDTSKVTNMSNAFTNMRSLSQIDLSKWNFNSVTNFNNMFAYDYTLASYGDFAIPVNIATVGGIFRDCWVLRYIKLSGTISTQIKNTAFYTTCSTDIILDLTSLPTLESSN